MKKSGIKGVAGMQDQEQILDNKENHRRAGSQLRLLCPKVLMSFSKNGNSIRRRAMEYI